MLKFLYHRDFHAARLPPSDRWFVHIRKTGQLATRTKRGNSTQNWLQGWGGVLICLRCYEVCTWNLLIYRWWTMFLLFLNKLLLFLLSYLLFPTVNFQVFPFLAFQRPRRILRYLVTVLWHWYIKARKKLNRLKMKAHVIAKVSETWLMGNCMFT